MPLAILVDDKTASAAEIFTAALQDHRRALVIGETTLGKGLVQTIYRLSPESSALCITTAAYFPPSNRKFHQKGLVPDITPLPEFSDLKKPSPVKDMKRFLSPENPALRTALRCL
jgi:carboxyl-terminal processing protease